MGFRSLSAIIARRYVIQYATYNVRIFKADYKMRLDSVDCRKRSAKQSEVHHKADIVPSRLVGLLYVVRTQSRHSTPHVCSAALEDIFFMMMDDGGCFFPTV